MSIKTILHSLLPILFILSLAILSYSVIRTGLFYQYDNDEVSYAQYAYLFKQGFAPYQDFHLTILPIFSWALSILFGIVGFNFESLLIARVLMVVMFFLRIGVSYLLFREVFNARVAKIFIPLLIFDPFTMFTGMQIRPDNFMLLIYTLGLFILYYGVKKESVRLMALTGVLFSLSILVLLKILPAVFIAVCFLTLYCLRHKKMIWIFWFAVGMLTPLILASTYFTLKGVLPEVIQQTIIDRRAFNDALLNPTSPWFFYRGENYELFGYPGKPATWLYVWVLPVVALGVVLKSIFKLVRKKNYLQNIANSFKLMTAVLLGVQWLGIFVVSGFFSQYFLLISWLWAAWAAVFIDDVNALLQRKLQKPVLKYIFNGAVVIIFIVFTLICVGANSNRASVSHEPYRRQLVRLWGIIPSSEKTFPNVLFRPFSYPIVLGTFIGDVPVGILKRYKAVHEYLEKDKVKFLLLDSYLRQFLGPDTNTYIDAHYKEMETEKGVYTRL